VALREEFEKTGNWLFRWRSYFPFLLVPFLLLALRDSEQIQTRWGNTAHTLWEIVCITISFLGLILRCITIAWVPDGTSGRNTQAQRAEVLNTQGVYSVVRHPLYLGNFLITMGFVLFVQVGWFVVFTALLFWLYYERIMFAEEEFLRRKFGESFTRWAKITPAFLPNFSRWKYPDLQFSWKMVLRREYAGFFGIIVTFILLNFFAEWLGEGEIEFRLFSGISFLAGLVVYLVLRTLRRKTKLLNPNPNR